MREMIDSVFSLLKKGEGIVMATIIRHDGSTPRTTGARMAVRRNGEIIGTIGGGSFEASVQQRASEIYETGGASIQSFHMTQDALDGLGMICGGRADVLMEYLDANPDTLEIFEAAHNTFQNGRKCLWVTTLGDLNKIAGRIHHCLIMDGGRLYGNFPYPKPWINMIKDKTYKIRHSTLMPIEEEYFFVEPFFAGGVLYLFGAGHISRHTAVQAMRVGFRTVILDDREEFANRECFPNPADVRVIEDFSGCLAGLGIDENCYLVIVTRGHLHDAIVLEQALMTGARFIGMIGSRPKRDTIYRALLEKGFTGKALQRVHCPIGLDIGAETPEEIAISIVAELVQVRSRKGM